MHVLKNVTKPTTLFVLGADVNGVKETFGITDDYHSLKVVHGETKKLLDTDSRVFVLTEAELLEYLEKELIQIEDNSCELIVINDFVGEVKVSVITESGADILKGFNPGEYLMHQVESEADDDVDDYQLEFSGVSTGASQLFSIEVLDEAFIRDKKWL